MVLLMFAGMLIFSSCNKGVIDLGDLPAPSNPNSSLRALGDTLNTPARANDSLYYAMIVKSGLLSTLNNKNTSFTMFVPTNAAVRTFITAITGGAVPSTAPDAAFKSFINSASFPAASAAGIVSFNITPQALPSTSISTSFPNQQVPTLINPAPQLSALLRLTTFPSNRNGFYLNNIPMITLDIRAANGIIHEVASVQTPPQQFLWDRINADSVSTNPNALRYLKAAILRADSGVAVTTSGSLEGALKNIGANLTVYAPTDLAFQQLLTGLITQALIAQGVPPATAAAQATFLASSPTVFSNPALYGSLTAQTVKGVIVYHILGVRAFNNNLPTTQTNFPTLLNSAVPSHPGIGLKATFTGTFVSAATVKGIANPTASNILINPTPGTGSSDQFFLNGVLHKIDQVLRPQ